MSSVSEMTDLCRLCFQKNNLVSILKKDNQRPENMKDIVYITTGVQISTKDCISQKICEKCCQLSLEMYQFRLKAQENDQKLKEQWKMHLKSQQMHKLKSQPNNKMKPELKSSKHEIISPKIHPSIETFCTMYKNILLPSIVLKFNLLPHVSMKVDEVEEYYKTRNIDMQEHLPHALKSCKKKDTIELPSDKKTDETSKKTKHNINKRSISDSEIDAPITAVVKKSTSTDSSQLDGRSIKKPKLSLSDSLTPEKKSAFVESLGWMQTKIKEIPLLNCDICNSVHYNSTELKRHRLNHLRCQFCKVQFKSMERKNQHIDSKHRPPFLGLSSIPGTDDIKVVPPHSHSPENKIMAQETSVDVIEIISDDESSNAKFENRVDISNTVYKPLVQNTNNYNTYGSSSIVRPNITIKDFNFLDVMEGKTTDTEILNQLLKFRNKLQISSDQFTQTELPDNSSIHINSYETTADLEYLKQQLHVFKVPIEITRGSSLQVSYNYENPIKKSRKRCDWNELQLIDVKTPIYGNMNKYKPIVRKENVTNVPIYKAPATFSNQGVAALSTNDSTSNSSPGNQLNGSANTVITIPVDNVTTYRNSAPSQQPVACDKNASLSIPNSTCTTTLKRTIESNIPSTVVTSNPSSAAPMPGSIIVKNNGTPHDLPNLV